MERPSGGRHRGSPDTHGRTDRAHRRPGALPSAWAPFVTPRGHRGTCRSACNRDGAARDRLHRLQRTCRASVRADRRRSSWAGRAGHNSLKYLDKPGGDRHQPRSAAGTACCCPSLGRRRAGDAISRASARSAGSHGAGPAERRPDAVQRQRPVRRPAQPCLRSLPIGAGRKGGRQSSSGIIVSTGGLDRLAAQPYADGRHDAA